MARVKITTSDLLFNRSLESVTWTPADATNNHYMVHDGQCILLARNSDATSKTVTIVSVADPRLRRLGDAQILVAASTGGVNGVAFYGLLPADGWRQTGTTNVNVNVSAATGLSLAVIRIAKA
jgi:hypothetical protein